MKKYTPFFLRMKNGVKFFMCVMIVILKLFTISFVENKIPLQTIQRLKAFIKRSIIVENHTIDDIWVSIIDAQNSPLITRKQHEHAIVYAGNSERFFYSSLAKLPFTITFSHDLYDAATDTHQVGSEFKKVIIDQTFRGRKIWHIMGRATTEGLRLTIPKVEEKSI